MIVFPKFKRDRGSQYFKFLTQFSEQQTTGSEKNIEIWTTILENCT
jgi:ribosomal protein S18